MFKFVTVAPEDGITSNPSGAAGYGEYVDAGVCCGVTYIRPVTVKTDPDGLYTGLGIKHRLTFGWDYGVRATFTGYKPGFNVAEAINGSALWTSINAIIEAEIEVAPGISIDILGLLSWLMGQTGADKWAAAGAFKGKHAFSGYVDQFAAHFEPSALPAAGYSDMNEGIFVPFPGGGSIATAPVPTGGPAPGVSTGVDLCTATLEWYVPLEVDDSENAAISVEWQFNTSLEYGWECYYYGPFTPMGWLPVRYGWRYKHRGISISDKRAKVYNWTIAPGTYEIIVTP